MNRSLTLKAFSVLHITPNSSPSSNPQATTPEPSKYSPNSPNMNTFKPTPTHSSHEAPLRPTPISPTSRATLEALEDIERRSLLCIPGMEWSPSYPDTSSTKSLRKLWQRSEEDLVQRAATTSRVSYEFGYYIDDQNEQEHSPALLPSWTSLDLPTASRAHDVDLRGQQYHIGQALRSVQMRRPEVWRETMEQRTNRGESMDTIQRRLQDKGKAPADPKLRAAYYDRQRAQSAPKMAQTQQDGVIRWRDIVALNL